MKKFILDLGANGYLLLALNESQVALLEYLSEEGVLDSEVEFREVTDESFMKIGD